jgi:hypothetical protein
MDPYLEAPGRWPDFHNTLAVEIKHELNRTLPPPYYAQVEARPELGIIEEGRPKHRYVSDIVVARPREHAASDVRTALLDRPRADVSKSFQVTIQVEPIQHYYVEIRDPSHGHRLVTLIEILSPSNKLSGPDRDAYRRKQLEVLRSDASLIEIDLLRAGTRVLATPELETAISQLDPRPDYLVLMSRAWNRATGAMGYQGFPVTLREWLPCIPIPLREGEAEPLLDLQFVFNRIYDLGAYHRGAIDYDGPPNPTLSEPDAAWAAKRVEEWARARSSSS